MTTKQFTAKNILFLKTSLNLTTEQLAWALNIPEPNLKIYELAGLPLIADTLEYLDNLNQICYAFTIKLEDLIFSDISTSELDLSGITSKIKNEMFGTYFDRKAFHDSFLNRNDSEVDFDDKIDNLKQLLTRSQILFVKQKEHKSNAMSLLEQYIKLEKEELVEA